MLSCKCYTSSLRALVISLLWADPRQISALSTLIRNSSRILPDSYEKCITYKNVIALKAKMQNEGTATPSQKSRRTPIYLSSPCLSIPRYETTNSMPQSLSTLSIKDAACIYKPLLAYEKARCRRQYISSTQALRIGAVRDTISSHVSLQANSAALHFYLDFLACIVNKFYFCASNKNQLWV